MERSFVVLLAALSACDPPRESDADAEPPTARRADEAPVAKSPAPQARANAMPQAQPLVIRVDAVRRVIDTIEIEVALDRPLPMLARSRPTLHVGDETVRRSRRPHGALDRLVFLVDGEQFARMTDGATLVVTDVGFSSASMPSAPVLDKASLVTP